MGTLGLILLRPAGAFAMTCRHVLAPPGFSVGALNLAPIYQPALAAPTNEIGRLSVGLVSAALDLAAFPIHPQFGVTTDVRGLVRTVEFRPAVDGLPVYLAGAQTGTSHGVVAVDNNTGETLIHPADPNRPFAAIGDSGAVWFESGTANPVALHTGVGWTPAGTLAAVVLEMGTVMAALQPLGL